MRIVIAVLAVLLVALQVHLWREWQQVKVLNERLTEQQAANEALKARNDALFAEVQDLREGLDAIEERARSELGLIGEDESFYLIVDPELAAETPRPDSRAVNEPSTSATDGAVERAVSVPNSDPNPNPNPNPRH